MNTGVEVFLAIIQILIIKSLFIDFSYFEGWEWSFPISY